MKITVRFFASLKELLKTSELQLEIPSGVQTIAELREVLSQRGEVWEQAFAPHQNLRAAQDLEMVGFDALLKDHSEIAFFPPVTGG
jgi:molybdopterin synthase sulfur carrier subunit